MAITPSHFMPLGVSVVFYDAIVRGKNPLGNITQDMIGSYSHKLSAFGGFDTAKIEIGGNINVIEDWISNGIGRHIEVYSQDNALVWEGFVDQINIDVAGVSMTRGPMLDVCNRASVMYTPILDTTTDPQLLGTTTETTIAEDAPSQELYGIMENILSGGNMVDDGTTNDAEYVRDVYLMDSKNPKTTSNITIGATGKTGISLECKGYFHILDKYVYNDGTYNYSVTCTAKLQNVLGADPNAIISTDYSMIGSNLALTHGLEYTNRTAKDIISEILTFGDGDDMRWLFGIYEDVRPYYWEVPSEAEYQYSIYGENNVIRTMSGIVVHPWSVRPGKWVFISDFLAGRLDGFVDLREDSRAVFIESVSFTAPYSVTLSGENVGTLSQVLARLGYGGIS